jgi:SAM-dependent methyltransferase
MKISAFERVRRWLRLPTQSEPAHPFDVAHGVDTSGLYYADRLPSGHAHDRYSEGYYATAPSLFHGAMGLWMNSLGVGLRVEDYTFVDLGSGKGRVVMMASEYPFRAVRGIELNAGLVRAARRNLRRWMRGGRAVCRDVRVERGDVLGLDLPDEAVVLFLFNSFGAEVLAGLLEKVAGLDRRAPVDLVYVHPDHDGLVAGTAGTAGAELLRYAEVAFHEEDARADPFGVGSDMCSVWRLRGM